MSRIAGRVRRSDGSSSSSGNSAIRSYHSGARRRWARRLAHLRVMASAGPHAGMVRPVTISSAAMVTRTAAMSRSPAGCAPSQYAIKNMILFVLYARANSAPTAVSRSPRRSHGRPHMRAKRQHSRAMSTQYPKKPIAMKISRYRVTAGTRAYSTVSRTGGW